MYEHLMLDRDSSKTVMDFSHGVFYRLICRISPQRSNGGKCDSVAPLGGEL